MASNGVFPCDKPHAIAAAIASPEPIGETMRLELSRLEARGTMHGQWRAQERIAQDLVALRSSRDRG